MPPVTVRPLLLHRRVLFERTLVGVDFSPASVAALGLAERLTCERGRVDALHVVDEEWCKRVRIDSTEPMRSRVDQRLRGLLAEHCRETAARALVRHGTPTLETIVTCRREASDLLVIGAKIGQPRSTLGLVAEVLLHLSPIPTLLVPSGATPRVQRLVLAIDLAEPDEARVVLRAGLSLAERLRVGLSAAAVVPAGTYWRALAMDGLVDLLVSEGCDAAPAVLAGSDGVRAHAGPTDLVVTGSGQRSDDFRLGSATTSVLSAALCPVLVVRVGGQAE